MLCSNAQDISAYLFRQYLAKPELKQFLQQNQYSSIVNYSDIENLYLYYLNKYTTTHFDNLKDELIYKVNIIQQSLRLLRNHILANLIERQAQKLCDYVEVVTSMSNLADFSINTLVKIHTEQLNYIYNQPINAKGEAIPIIIMAMGKLGGNELNVSSDVDLVFLFEENGITQVSPDKISISHSEYFEKLGQRIIQGLNKINEYGFVFRVDMRLRPYGDIGSIVCDISMFEEYLLTQGRAWERFAWLKARQIYPSKPHQYLASLIQKFVYRRYLDYNLLEALRDVHKKISTEQNKKINQNSIKLGYGGIREIEFITQVYQLIHGGQKPILQKNNTIDTLPYLHKLNILPLETTNKLAQIYIDYRNIEHAIQYLRDEHTHNLPIDTNIEDWDKITNLIPLVLNTEQLKTYINQSKEYVHNIFKSIFYETKTEDLLFDLDNFQPEGALFQWLSDNKFAIPAQIIAHIQSLLGGARYRLLSEKAQQNFKTALYLGIIKCNKYNDNYAANLIRYLDFLNVISQRRSYLSLLIQYPVIIDKLINILGHSSWLANYIISHPQILDELLRSNGSIDFNWQEYKSNLAQKLNFYKNSLEQQLDVLRQTYHAEVFRILLAEIYGQYDTLKIADLLSALVDATLEETLNAVWSTIEINEPVPHFAIIAYGKLGGKELGYESDLDLVFLYDDEDTKLSDASNIYTYLARKLITWLTSSTTAGKVFEIDTRLRPNGQSGLLVSSIQSFKHYQEQRVSNSAWTWEHQALTRARFCAGNIKIGKLFEEIRINVLSTPRDKNILKQEIIAMRDKISQEKKYQDDSFNLKYSIGGMIDVEFIVQYLTLFYGSKYTQLLENLGNVQLLNIAAGYNLIDKQLASKVGEAYKYYRKWQYKLRLDYKKSIVPKQQVKQHIEAVVQLWHAIMD